MNRIFTYFFIFLAFSSLAESRPFELYEPIIDKCLFGEPPDDPSKIPEKSSSSNATRDEKEIAKEQERLEKAVAVSALQQTPDGTVKVGFSDASASKSPIHYYLAVGESKDGWLVKSADVTTKLVVLEKDFIEIERTLGASALPQAPAASAASASNNPLLRRSSLLSPRTSVNGSALIRSRRQMKREEEASERRANQEEIAKLKEAEAKKREEERARHEAEKAETRQMLNDLRDELKKQREAEQVQQNAAGDTVVEVQL